MFLEFQKGTMWNTTVQESYPFKANTKEGQKKEFGKPSTLTDNCIQLENIGTILKLDSGNFLTK